MPIMPSNTKCEQLGCKNPRSKMNTYCSEHGGKEYMSKESDSVYQSAFWKSTRRRQLGIQPLCQGCLSRNIVASASHVDHVFPWRRIGKHAFMRNIFQSLCHACHSTKTGQEHQGIFEHFTIDGIVTFSVTDYDSATSRCNT
jgi:5-methylcytosine-specific restriction protein A